MEDERQVELECISAIFPEIVLGSKGPFSASIDLPIQPTQPIKVVFATGQEGQLLTPLSSPPSTVSILDEARAPGPETIVDSHDLSFLPSLQLQITLPEGYPENAAPYFELSTSPAWLPRSTLDDLQEKGKQMWEEEGRNQIVYGYLDFLQQSAEDAFGFAQAGKGLEVSRDFKIALLDFDIKATQAAFAQETFDCGVCLDPKKGSVCHRMVDCGHVFCIQCLQDFYNNAITEGDLSVVRCLAPNCAKSRVQAQGATRKHRKPRTQLSPSELLQIPLSHDMVTRYVTLRHKTDLESDKDTIYCPRKWCQGAARSKKYRKPEGFEVPDESDGESDTEGDNPKNSKAFLSGYDLLSVCEDCSFAFCRRCYQGWHGEFYSCTPRQKNGELTEEEKASLDYMKRYTSPCPTCAAPAQKTHGCNHMICFKCNTHFCYLCSAWLSPSNPYEHFNEAGAGCYMRLWELERGDGYDVGLGHDEDEDEENQEDENGELPLIGIIAGLNQPHGRGRLGAAQPPRPNAAPAGPQAPVRAEAQREGPLVLRINVIPEPAPAVHVVAPEPPIAAPLNQRPGRQRQRNRQQPGGGHVQVGRGQQVGGVPLNAPALEEGQRAWVQNFVQMALNDEEDQVDWDSDEEEGNAWVIPVR